MDDVIKKNDFTGSKCKMTGGSSDWGRIVCRTMKITGYEVFASTEQCRQQQSYPPRPVCLAVFVFTYSHPPAIILPNNGPLSCLSKISVPSSSSAHSLPVK